MKRKGIAVVLAVLTLALAGCGEKENVITRENTTNDADSAVSGSDEKTSEKDMCLA